MEFQLDWQKYIKINNQKSWKACCNWTEGLLSSYVIDFIKKIF